MTQRRMLNVRALIATVRLCREFLVVQQADNVSSR